MIYNLYLMDSGARSHSKEFAELINTIHKEEMEKIQVNAP